MRPSYRSPAAAGVWVLLALAACRGREAPLSATPPGPSVAERVRVLNADVLVVDGRHIRLAEVYAPQPIPDARCWAEALAAKLALEKVRGQVRSAGEIRVEPTGRRDGYNRQVARVFLDRVDLARSLHEAGLAAAPPAGRFEWCQPISQRGAGAPALRSLMDFGRG